MMVLLEPSEPMETFDTSCGKAYWKGEECTWAAVVVTTVFCGPGAVANACVAVVTRGTDVVVIVVASILLLSSDPSLICRRVKTIYCQFDIFGLNRVCYWLTTKTNENLCTERFGNNAFTI